jgi:hypothetical protein
MTVADDDTFDVNATHWLAIIPSRTVHGNPTQFMVDTDTDLEGIFDTSEKADDFLVNVLNEYPELQGYIYKCVPHKRLTGKVFIKRKAL